MAPAGSSTTTDLTLKLYINTGAQRVVFAEASNDAIDLLQSLLASPDTAVSAEDATWHGCIDNFIDTLDELDYLEDHPAPPEPPLLPPPPPQQQRQVRRRFFLCGARRGAGCDGYVAVKSGVMCPSCCGRMDAEVPPGAPGAGCSGDAAAAPAVAAPEGAVTLMDDLSLGPSLGNALQALQLQAVGPLQDTTVRFGRKEGLEILKASLHSSVVLTDVFLRGKTSSF